MVWRIWYLTNIMLGQSILVLLCFLTACSYSHIDSTRAIFQRAGENLTLNVYRHLDTVMRGPDTEEDQRLVLELTGFEIGKRVPVPSANAVVRFDVQRFGPSSKGSEFTGYAIVKKVADDKVTAYLNLDVTAHTASGSYVQHAKYKGDFVFYRVGQHD